MRFNFSNASREECNDNHKKTFEFLSCDSYRFYIRYFTNSFIHYHVTNSRVRIEDTQWQKNTIKHEILKFLDPSLRRSSQYESGSEKSLVAEEFPFSFIGSRRVKPSSECNLKILRFLPFFFLFILLVFPFFLSTICD